MLTSPGGRGRSTAAGPAFFSIGLLAGALVSASVLWLASGIGDAVPDRVSAGVVVAGLAVAFARDYGLLHLWLPENRRLVPQTVLRNRLPRMALQFGFEMGTGARTLVPATAPYVVAVAIVLLEPSYLAAALAATGFAAGRALVPWARFAANDGDRWDQRLTMRTRSIIRCTAVLLIAPIAVLVAYA